MRRLLFTFLAVYLVLVGGGPYYYNVFAVRIFHHAAATILFGYWLIRRLRHGRGLPDSPLTVPLFAAVAVWLASAAFSLDPRISLESTWVLLLHVLLFFVIVDLIQTGLQRLVMETQFMLAALVALLALTQLGSWYFGWGLVPGTSIGWVNVFDDGVLIPLTSPDLYLPLGVTTWLSAYVAPLIVLAGAWAVTSRRREYRRVLLVLAGILLVVLVGASSRGGYISLGAALGVLFTLRLIRNERLRQFARRHMAATGIAVGVAAFAILAVVFIMGRDPSHWTGDRLRFDLWRSAVEMGRDHPALGVGVGMFGRGLRAYRDASYVDDRLGTAHNIVLHTLAETGIIGVLVLLTCAAVVIVAWGRRWLRADSTVDAVRLEAAFAALTGIAVQSLFDTFTMTSIVSLIVLLTAYCVTVPGSRLNAPARGYRRAAAAASLLLVAYAVGFYQADRAQSAFISSLSSGGDGLADARVAADLDPSLRLYNLQIAYLIGQDALAGRAELSDAIGEYEHALQLEPTWLVGWINLAGLEERQGNYERALSHLEQARAIQTGNATAAGSWARIAEAHALAPDDSIVQAYFTAMIQLSYPPLSEALQSTPPQQRALEQYMADDNLPLSWRFRVAAAHVPERLSEFVPDTPTNAEEWWAKGEYALEVANDPQTAYEFFSRAIDLSPRSGDLYVSRARASLQLDRESAARDLDLAQLLGTTHEYPNAVRATLGESPEETQRLRAAALPARTINQNFEGVLYQGRTASFDVDPLMRLPGRGTRAMQPWYDLAETYLDAQQEDRAVNVYRAIVDYAPDERLAQEMLEQLSR